MNPSSLCKERGRQTQLLTETSILQGREWGPDHGESPGVTMVGDTRMQLQGTPLGRPRRQKRPLIKVQGPEWREGKG